MRKYWDFVGFKTMESDIVRIYEDEIPDGKHIRSVAWERIYETPDLGWTMINGDVDVEDSGEIDEL
jgi:hypothetical protein